MHAILVFIESSRTAGATHKNPALKKKIERKKKGRKQASMHLLE